MTGSPPEKRPAADLLQILSLRSRIPSSSGSSGKPWRQSRSLHGRMSLLDLRLNGGMVLQEGLLLSLLGSNLPVFTIAELRAITRDFSIYKGYVEEKRRRSSPASTASPPYVVKLLDLEALPQECTKISCTVICAIQFTVKPFFELVLRMQFFICLSTLL